MSRKWGHVAACRQGDPGSTRYFLSLEDNMFRIFGGDRIKGMMGMFQIDDLPIESGLLVGPLPHELSSSAPGQPREFSFM